MTKFRKTLFALSLMTVSHLGLAADSYTLDPNHTYVLFHINHLGFSTQVGKWYASGNLTLDEKNPQNSKVTATIPVDKLSTGLTDLDSHLKEKTFFDVARYPTATFTSTKVVMNGKQSAKVYGTLTLRGVAKPVVLNATFNKAGKNPINGKDMVGFSATLNLKRSDFGMTEYLPNLGDEVTLEIGAEAAKNSAS